MAATPSECEHSMMTGCLHTVGIFRICVYPPFAFLRGPGTGVLLCVVGIPNRACII